MFSLLYGPTLKSIHDYWKDHHFDYTDLGQQIEVSAFYLIYLYFFKFYFIFKLYNTVLVLPNIEMNPP